MVSTDSEGFPRRSRVLSPKEFRLIYDEGLRTQTRWFVLFSRSNGLGYHRIGITVSRKVGRSVVRNRIKRIFREIFRRFSADIPGHFDLVVNAKQDCATARYAALRDDFLSAARKICRENHWPAAR